MGQMDNSTAPATVGTVSARNYRPLRMVVISLLPELSRYPGDNAEARRGRFLLRRSACGVALWSGVRSPAGRQQGREGYVDISMRCSGRSTVNSCTCGAQSTRAGRCSTCWCRGAGMRKPRSASSSSSSKVVGLCCVSSGSISSPARHRQEGADARCCALSCAHFEADSV